MQKQEAARLFDFYVRDVSCVAKDLYVMHIFSPELARALHSGQFINFEVLGDPSHILRIPLSFSACDCDSGIIELVFGVVGEGTYRLAHMRPQEKSSVIGPCGKGWRLSDLKKDVRVLLVSGGLGVAPVLSAARELGKRDISFDVIMGARSADMLWGVPEFEAAGAKSVAVTTDDGSKGLPGFTTDEMQKRNLTDYSLILSCGPYPMLAGVAKYAADYELSCQVSLEALMACGFGACNCCNLPSASGGYLSCCMDGPVMDAKELAWQIQ